MRRELRRIEELDILRGLLLLVMMIDHFPGFWTYYTYQPLGFVSGAEVFVFLSAFLVGRIYLKYDDKKLWIKWLKSRVLKLYIIHLITLVITLSIIWYLSNSYNSYYKYVTILGDNSPLTIISALLLLYQPPFLDILPTYIVMLLITPLYFYLANRFDWEKVLIFSFFIWILAQFGIREFCLSLFSNYLFVDMGAFDDFAWQFLWYLGIYFGIYGFNIIQKKEILIFYVLIALFFFSWKAPYIPFFIELGEFEWLIDKWHLGLLRLLNLFLLIIIFIHLKEFFNKFLKYLSFATYLGKHSLTVLSIHVCFTLISLGLIDEFQIDNLGIALFLSAQIVVIIMIIVFIENRKRRTLKTIKELK